jgi:hypothetical protein
MAWPGLVRSLSATACPPSVYCFACHFYTQKLRDITGQVVTAWAFPTRMGALMDTLVVRGALKQVALSRQDFLPGSTYRAYWHEHSHATVIVLAQVGWQTRPSRQARRYSASTGHHLV